MSFIPPFNLHKWIAEHQDKLRPPVCNQQVFEDGDFIIMVVGGPNQRQDYHDDPGEEFFYQLKGDMILRVMTEGKPKEVRIKEGDVFLLPAHIHHSPQRFADTLGIVIERKRRPDEYDSFLWYCEHCHQQLHRATAKINNIVEDLPILFKAFLDDKEQHTCQHCHHTTTFNASL